MPDFGSGFLSGLIAGRQEIQSSAAEQFSKALELARLHQQQLLNNYTMMMQNKDYAMNLSKLYHNYFMDQQQMQMARESHKMQMETAQSEIAARTAETERTKTLTPLEEKSQQLANEQQSALWPLEKSNYEIEHALKSEELKQKQIETQMLPQQLEAYIKSLNAQADWKKQMGDVAELRLKLQAQEALVRQAMEQMRLELAKQKAQISANLGQERLSMEAARLNLQERNMMYKVAKDNLLTPGRIIMNLKSLRDASTKTHDVYSHVQTYIDNAVFAIAGFDNINNTYGTKIREYAHADPAGLLHLIRTAPSNYGDREHQILQRMGVSLGDFEKFYNSYNSSEYSFYNARRGKMSLDAALQSYIEHAGAMRDFNSLIGNLQNMYQVITGSRTNQLPLGTMQLPSGGNSLPRVSVPNPILRAHQVPQTQPTHHNPPPNDLLGNLFGRSLPPSQPALSPPHPAQQSSRKKVQTHAKKKKVQSHTPPSRDDWDTIVPFGEPDR